MNEIIYVTFYRLWPFIWWLNIIMNDGPFTHIAIFPIVHVFPCVHLMMAAGGVQNFESLNIDFTSSSTPFYSQVKTDIVKKIAF